MGERVLTCHAHLSSWSLVVPAIAPVDGTVTSLTQTAMKRCVLHGSWALRNVGGVGDHHQLHLWQKPQWGKMVPTGEGSWLCARRMQLRGRRPQGHTQPVEAIRAAQRQTSESNCCSLTPQWGRFGMATELKNLGLVLPPSSGALAFDASRR